jgi:hypothetical protein
MTYKHLLMALAVALAAPCGAAGAAGAQARTGAGYG